MKHKDECPSCGQTMPIYILNAFKPLKFDEVFERIKEKTDIRHQASLAKVLGMKESSISRIKTQGDFPASWAFKIGLLYGLDINILVTGKPFKKVEPKQEI